MEFFRFEMKCFLEVELRGPICDNARRPHTSPSCVLASPRFFGTANRLQRCLSNSMRNLVALTVVLMVIQSGRLWAVDTQPASSKPLAVQAFRLPDISETMVEVAPSPESAVTVVCFLGTECPLAKLYAPRLSKLAADFPAARFVAVNSNRQDSACGRCKLRPQVQANLPDAQGSSECCGRSIWSQANS